MRSVCRAGENRAYLGYYGKEEYYVGRRMLYSKGEYFRV